MVWVCYLHPPDAAQLLVPYGAHYFFSLGNFQLLNRNGNCGEFFWWFHWYRGLVHYQKYWPPLQECCSDHAYGQLLVLPPVKLRSLTLNPNEKRPSCS